MAEDATVQHSAPVHPSHSPEEISINPPAFTSLDTMPPSDNDKHPHINLPAAEDTTIQPDLPPNNDVKNPNNADLSVPASIDTGGLISLFRLLKNFKQFQNDLWGLAGMPDPEGWKLFQKASQAVEKVTVIQQPFQEGTITPATFVRIARMLAGGPLFPNLRQLQIEDLSQSTNNYLALLAAPGLEHITLIYRPRKDPELQQAEDTDYSELTTSLLTDLTFHSRQLRTFHAKKAVPAMSISVLQTISNFSELRVLKLKCLLRIPAGELNLYIQCLEHLRSLEALWLRLEEIVTDGSSNQTLAPVKDPERISIRSGLLPMTQLDIVGPAHLVSKTISTFGSRALRMVTISLPYTSMSLSMILSGKKGKKGATLDLKPLKEIAELQSLHLLGGVPNPSIALFEAGVWLHLVSLKLPRSMVVDLAQLKSIAEALPSLRVLALWLVEFGLLSTPNSIIVSTEVPLYHPLETLNLLNSSGPSIKVSQKLDRVHRCIRIAHYLNALFPGLRSLTAERHVGVWEVVFELIKLCQASLVAEKNRRNLFPDT